MIFNIHKSGSPFNQLWVCQELPNLAMPRYSLSKHLRTHYPGCKINLLYSAYVYAKKEI